MTAKEVLGSLCGIGSNCLWSPFRLVAVPNTVSVAGWEADLLLLQPSGWLWEIEIKVSVSDFRREFRTKKQKHEVLRTGKRPPGPWSSVATTNKHVQKFFFALPKEVFEKLGEDEIPEYAGVIVVDPERVDLYGRVVPYVVRRAKNLPGAVKANYGVRIRLLDLAHARFWAAAYKDRSLLEVGEE